MCIDLASNEKTKDDVAICVLQNNRTIDMDFTTIFERLLMKKASVLNDLQGKPYCFFRGHDNVTGFWSNLIDLAKEYDSNNIWVANIAVKNPIVVDCTKQSYGSIEFDKLLIEPSDGKKNLLSFLHDKGNIVGSDDFANFLRHYTQYDAIILKNIREGCFEDYPIYDIIVYDERNIVDIKRLSEQEQKKMKQYAIKRIDLSKYIVENEIDGYFRVITNDGYSVKWVLIPELYKVKIILDIEPFGGKTYKYAQLSNKGLYFNPNDILNPALPIDISEGVKLDITGYGESFAETVTVNFLQ